MVFKGGKKTLENSVVKGNKKLNRKMERQYCLKLNEADGKGTDTPPALENHVAAVACLSITWAGGHLNFPVSTL